MERVLKYEFPIDFKVWTKYLVAWSKDKNCKEDIIGDRTLLEAVKNVKESGGILVGLVEDEPVGFFILYPIGDMLELSVYAPGNEKQSLPIICEFALRAGYKNLVAKMRLSRFSFKNDSIEKAYNKSKRVARHLGWKLQGIVETDTGELTGVAVIGDESWEEATESLMPGSFN